MTFALTRSLLRKWIVVLPFVPATGSTRKFVQLFFNIVLRYVRVS